MSSKQPSLEEFNEVLSSLQQPLSWDVGEPLGSATRILAGILLPNPVGRFAWIHLEMTEQNRLLKESPPSEDALFGEDLDAVLAGMKHIITEFLQ